eukprot:1109798-Prymnesium_polylepis.2
MPKSRVRVERRASSSQPSTTKVAGHGWLSPLSSSSRAARSSSRTRTRRPLSASLATWAPPSVPGGMSSSSPGGRWRTNRSRISMASLCSSARAAAAANASSWRSSMGCEDLPSATRLITSRWVRCARSLAFA